MGLVDLDGQTDTLLDGGDVDGIDAGHEGGLPRGQVEEDLVALGFDDLDEGFDLEDAILRLILKAIAQANGNVSAAARILGVPRDYLRYRLAKAKKSD